MAKFTVEISNGKKMPPHCTVHLSRSPAAGGSGAMAGGGCAGPLLLLTLLLLGPRLRSGHQGHYRSLYTQVAVELESILRLRNKVL